MSDIQAFGYLEGAADTVFSDEWRLRVFPTSPVSGVGTVKVDVCVLTREEAVIAAATLTGFWSDEQGQAVLAERLGAAIEAERRLYRGYRSGRIEESQWQEKFRGYWKVMIRCREIHGKLVVGALPVTNDLDGLGTRWQPED